MPKGKRLVGCMRDTKLVDGVISGVLEVLDADVAKDIRDGKVEHVFVEVMPDA